VALVLNPPTVDAYESKTLAQMIQLVLNGCGFIDPVAVQRQTQANARPGGANYSRFLKDIRISIINRLGLAVALLASTDTFTNIYNDVYQATGYAGMSSAPAGAAEMIGVLINEAQKMLFTRIELDKGGITAPSTFSGSTQSSIDASLLRAASIALVKAHFGKQDAGAYGAQVETYLKNISERTPPNITGQVNAAIVAANDAILRRYETGNTGTFTSRFGSGITYAGNFASTASDTDVPDADDYAVELLALANLKVKIGQSDAKALSDQYEQYMADLERRCPANARSLIRQTLKDVQDELYHSYAVFRMERWYAWTTVAGQRFYGTFGDDDANSLAPTDLVATVGDAVTSHNLAVARGSAATITLRNGKVLIAGGVNGASVTATAELYDPATGEFTTTGNMIAARQDPMWAMLDDGRILIAGGTQASVLATAEIYNPATGVFSPTGSLIAARFGSVMVKLLDSRVLVTGGVNASNTVLSSSEIYDPATGLFTTTGSLVAARFQASAVLLPNGNVLVSGGTTNSTDPLSTAEIYNTAAGTFATTGAMVHARQKHVAVLLKSGKALLISGQDTSTTFTATCELFDPLSGTFSATGSITTGRFGHSAALLQNGKVIVVGGITVVVATPTPLSSAYLYDPDAGTFSLSGAMPYAVFGSNAAPLQDGNVLFPGGLATLTSSVNTAVVYSADADTFSATGNLTQGTDYYQITAYTANGESSPSTECFVAAVPANTGTVITFDPVDNQPFVLGYNLYGRNTGGTKKKIGTITRSQNTNPDGTQYFVDDGTAPPDGDLPTINATAGPGALDPRRVTWVGAAQNEVGLRPLTKGIPPTCLDSSRTGPPQFYEIRQSLEIWPTPDDGEWKIYIKGFFPPFVFEDDNDNTTVDWKAVQLQAIADVKALYPKRFSVEEQRRAQAKVAQYVGTLVAGSHQTARYIPGRGNRMLPNAVPPKLA
jgi:hypothetical protein